MDRVVLVTGANGFVGKHVVSHLISKPGYTVVASDFQNDSAEFTEHTENISYRGGDIRQESFVEELAALGPFFGIIHLAGILTKEDTPPAHTSIFDANTVTTLRMLELARNRAQSFVFPSTGLIYGDQQGPFTEDMAVHPGDFYATSKLLSENLTDYFSRRYGLRTVVLRPSVIYGPGQRGSMLIPSLIRALADNWEYPLTPGEQKRDFVYVEDVADACMTALENSSAQGAFNIGSGEVRTIRDAALLCQTILGKSDLVKIGALSYRDNEVWEYALDCRKAHDQLGWKASVNLEDGIKRTIEQMTKESD